MASFNVAQIIGQVRHWIAFVGPRRVVGGIVSVVIVVAVGWWLLRSPAPPVETTIARADSASTSSTGVNAAVLPTMSSVPSAITVHVAGAVHKPGVYTLIATARVVDAVRAAGGATSGADLDLVNLAHPIYDSEHIYIPKRGQSTSVLPTHPRSPRPSQQQNTTSQPTTRNTRVNINTANASELETLPGVGPSTAKAIIAYRNTVSPFVTPEDVMKVSGIGPAKFEAMQDFITV